MLCIWQWVSQHLWGLNEGVLSNEITKATRQMTDCWYWFGLVHICLFCRQNPLSPIQRSWWQVHPWSVPLRSLCSVWPRRVWEGQTFSHFSSSTLPRSPCNEQNEVILKRIKNYYVSQKNSHIYYKFWKRTDTGWLERREGLTSNLSRIPRVYLCKFFLAGVNFYRFNAKNWHFSTDFTRKKWRFFTDKTRKIGVFRCKFYSPKILSV